MFRVAAKGTPWSNQEQSFFEFELIEMLAWFYEQSVAWKSVAN